MHGRANRHAPLAQQLTRLSANEMVSALGAGALPPLLRRGLALPLSALSRRLGATLAELDLSIDEVGLAAAASRALQSFGVTARASGEAVGAGPCLVLANHPGAYDALALMSAIGREDLAILAADRGFLRSLPRLSRQLLFVGADVTTRVHRIELGDQLAVAPVFEHEARLRGALLSAIQRA